ELVVAKNTLEGLIGAEVTSLAYPYGVEPDKPGRSLVAATYSAACTAKLGYMRLDDDPYSLPRVDAHFVRRPRALNLALAGSGAGYLTARRWATRARHSFVSDYASPALAASSGGRS
ncbi:MAG: hypothetical protein QOE13_2910, partial [Gaiellaceae bacterium]|nr:hypothetical protein [Gaiellaceae bacterium]